MSSSQSKAGTDDFNQFCRNVVNWAKEASARAKEYETAQKAASKAKAKAKRDCSAQKEAHRTGSDAEELRVATEVDSLVAEVLLRTEIQPWGNASLIIKAASRYPWLYEDTSKFLHRLMPPQLDSTLQVDKSYVKGLRTDHKTLTDEAFNADVLNSEAVKSYRERRWRASELPDLSDPGTVEEFDAMCLALTGVLEGLITQYSQSTLLLDLSRHQHPEDQYTAAKANKASQEELFQGMISRPSNWRMLAIQRVNSHLFCLPSVAMPLLWNQAVSDGPGAVEIHVLVAASARDGDARRLVLTEGI